MSQGGVEIPFDNGSEERLVAASFIRKLNANS
jgi:hypothetical protein